MAGKRTVEVRADATDLPWPASEAWREEFKNDARFVKARPDTEAIDVQYDPEIKKRYQERHEIRNGVRKLRKRPDVMRRFGAHAGDETRKRREQDRLEAEVLREKAEKDASKHRERAIAARLAYAEEHWQELSTGGKRKNPHLAARLIYTKLLLAAKYDTGFKPTGTVPADLRTPAAIAAATGLSKRTVEQELAVLHDAGWIKVQSINSVPGRRTFGGEITLPPVDDVTLLRAGSIVHLLERMESVTWCMVSLAEKVLYLYLSTRPDTTWNRREDQRYSPVVDRAALTTEAITAATGLHRNSSRDAKRELIDSALLRDLGHDLEIVDPQEIPELREARARARMRNHRSGQARAI